MNIDERIKAIVGALKLTKPDKCAGCKYIEEHKSGEYTDYYCNLIEDSYKACINYEIEEGDINAFCPLLDPEEDSYYIQTLTDELEALVELKESRIRLKRIEELAREAFNNPDTINIDLYRAQKLAEIFQIFEYNGSTIPREEGK